MCNLMNTRRMHTHTERIKPAVFRLENRMAKKFETPSRTSIELQFTWCLKKNQNAHVMVLKTEPDVYLWKIQRDQLHALFFFF